ncbi:glutathione S-transferase-like protein [Mycena epipterygia]|nr:glutathione S-transferase-like protein [Mycena epipterygia]
MVLKLYSVSEAAGGSGIVALVLIEKQIPFEHVRVDIASKQHKTPEFLAMHPFGQVPVIDDDGFILYETRAICRYLVEKYPDQGTPLVPTSIQGRAIFEQGASIEMANFHPAVMKVAIEAVGKKRQGLPVDQAFLAQAIAEFSAKLDVYEVILGKQKFLGGDELSLVDLFHFFFAPLLAGAGIDIMTSRGPDTNVTRWWNTIISRPAWVKLRAEGIKSTASY